MKRTQSTGGVVLNKLGQIAVVSQGGTAWSLPKGHVEEGENFLETAIREIYEETGLKDLKFIKELGSYERLRGNENPDSPTEMKTITMFLFETNEMELKPVDPDNPEARWVDKKDVEKLLTFEKDKEFFVEVKNLI